MDDRTARVFDVHAHVVLPATMGLAGAAGPEMREGSSGAWFRVGDYELQGVRYVGTPFVDADLRIERMDSVGITAQLLSPNPLTYFADLDARTADAYCRRHNDELAELIGRYPNRLFGACQLPMQDVELSCQELQRSVRDLGLVAAYVDTNPPYPLDHPAMDEFYSCVSELDVPLFLHPTSVPAPRATVDPRLARFDLDMIAGFANSEALAVATLIYGGVLERHPRIDICVSHGGGSLAALHGRMALASETRPWAPPHLRDGGFEKSLRRLWFDVHVHSRTVLDQVQALVGRDRLVFGTNFSGWDSVGVSVGGHDAAIHWDNPRRLLRRAEFPVKAL